MEQLAALVGVSWQTVQQWEKNTAPKRTRLEKVAQELWTTPAYLQGHTDNPARAVADKKMVTGAEKQPSPTTENERLLLEAYRNADPKVRDIAPQLMISGDEWRALAALRKMDLESRKATIARLEVTANELLIDAERQSQGRGARSHGGHSQ